MRTLRAGGNDPHAPSSKAARSIAGYPDFYPSRPGFNQTEDVLTDEFVKNGFSAKTFVAVGVSRLRRTLGHREDHALKLRVQLER